jgi:lysophospholipase L1-like esterase
MTFWNINPLWDLVTPNIANNWVKSMLEISDKGGWLPKGPTGIEYSGIMVASHEIPFIVGAYMKGIRKFDAQKAFQAIKKVQTEPGRPHPAGGYVGNHNLESYMKYGFVPNEDGPVSNTLEYAYDDWAAGQFALALGDSSNYKIFTKRAYNYENVFDSTVGYMRQKHEDSTWVKDFSPYGHVAWLGPGYVEGNAWQYTYFVPHDMKGLIQLMGRDTFNTRLEAGFEKSLPYKFNSEKLGSNSLEGMGILPVNHGNQPNMEAAYLFDFSGKPWLTQKWARAIMDLYYGSTPEDGWLGDEDQGQMGAWYAMSAMGLFEMDGGTALKPVYEIGSPLFRKITIHLDPEYYPGGEFVIEAPGNSKENMYIQSATLNGKPLNKPWFYHDQLVKGGKLVLKMGPKPNKKWGSNPDDAPPSMSSFISPAEKDSILKYDPQAAALAEWNRALRAYYYTKKQLFELLPVTKDEIVFLGNSITDNAEWAELFQDPNIKNRGIGGDDTDGVLERLDEVIASKPAKIFIMIGTNDLAYLKSVKHVEDNYVKIIDRLMKGTPDTKIYIQSILPTNDKIHIHRKNTDIMEINQFLKKLAADKGLTYIDLYSVFVTPDNEFNSDYTFDGLHPNGKAYLIWKEKIQKYVGDE